MFLDLTDFYIMEMVIQEKSYVKQKSWIHPQSEAHKNLPSYPSCFSMWKPIKKMLLHSVITFHNSVTHNLKVVLNHHHDAVLMLKPPGILEIRNVGQEKKKKKLQQL